MKRLFLIRHAKSSWKDPGLADRKRPLNKRGKRDALAMGAYLHSLGIQPECCYVSPAKRAQATAKRLNKSLNLSKKQLVTVPVLYDGSTTEILSWLQSLPDHLSEVMVIGHNPMTTELVHYLGDKPVTNLPTCSVYGMEFPHSSWREIGEKTGKCILLCSPADLPDSLYSEIK